MKKSVVVLSLCASLAFASVAGAAPANVPATDRPVYAADAGDKTSEAPAVNVPEGLEALLGGLSSLGEGATVSDETKEQLVELLLSSAFSPASTEADLLAGRDYGQIIKLALKNGVLDDVAIADVSAFVAAAKKALKDEIDHLSYGRLLQLLRDPQKAEEVVRDALEKLLARTDLKISVIITDDLGFSASDVIRGAKRIIAATDPNLTVTRAVILAVLTELYFPHPPGHGNGNGPGNGNGNDHGNGPGNGNGNGNGNGHGNGNGNGHGNGNGNGPGKGNGK